VWPWIAQIGQGRGGFYSYDALENLIGCNIHSARRVHPEWQQIAPGDEIRLAPELALHVAVLEPRRALVLQGGPPVARNRGKSMFDIACKRLDVNKKCQRELREVMLASSTS
jgi:hypothetical protein